MRAKENEPILTADGKSVAALWAVTVDLPGSVFRFAIAPKTPMFAHSEDGIGKECVAQSSIFHHVTMPDGRNYWRISEGAPPDWMGSSRYFKPKPSDPGPGSPEGVIAAIDELLERHKPLHDVARWLNYIKGYYRHVIDSRR
jgi:hypothetical protein